MSDFILYLRLGFEHVIPLGFDHILFIVSLYFLNQSLRQILIQCTVFTVAHSISLIAAAMGLAHIPAAITEPLIAFSIVITASENLVERDLSRHRLFIVFLFGLIHGMGFASVLRELGLPADSFYLSLFSFNAGVEIAQVLIIAVLWLLAGKFLSVRTDYRKYVVIPINAMIACIALYWTIIRIW